MHVSEGLTVFLDVIARRYVVILFISLVSLQSSHSGRLADSARSDHAQYQ